MKKLLFLTLMFCGVMTISARAQNTDPSVILQQMKERLKSPMVEKTGLTEAQADKVIEINFEIRMAASKLRDLSEADRSARIAELQATKQKRYADIPLSETQVKAVNSFFENMARNAPPKN